MWSFKTRSSEMTTQLFKWQKARRKKDNPMSRATPLLRGRMLQPVSEEATDPAEGRSMLAAGPPGPAAAALNPTIGGLSNLTR